jgi:hypothetical protein
LRQADNLNVVGSNPTPATILTREGGYTELSLPQAGAPTVFKNSPEKDLQTPEISLLSTSDFAIDPNLQTRLGFDVGF